MLDGHLLLGWLSFTVIVHLLSLLGPTTAYFGSRIESERCHFEASQLVSATGCLQFQGVEGNNQRSSVY
ncbi:hypothetical protein CHARACLAT_032679 [Characodon lateralis]|uniref:Uncharacterized protein n=1 Tax=Characodon lateralis TaxID=208331 RepID=A0ABU7EF27_9TELE|nr:hypothetical protein [Characodon lateralis]